ncbi:L-threonylcarbamoyladenylate synthase [Paenibacillus sp. CN-4]|uniref:L-threonylcarbamoyladenylate synthase n=1 Tax=Paenibacillus nanchangensis TaxID=3348343 RepID=UPI0039797913
MQDEKSGEIRLPAEETRCWRLDYESGGELTASDHDAIRKAAEMLRAGGTVAFPTETVYGLGADARRTEAVEAVFAAKGRPSDNPLIVHIADPASLAGLAASVPAEAAALMAAFWPGPLTVVLPVRPGVLSARVTAGLDTVGVRMPDHPVALALIEASGCPVAAPSANRSGRPSPTLAAHVLDDLAGRIGGVVDGGACGVGLESTVVQVQPDGRVAVLRPGGITAEQLEGVVGEGRVVSGSAAEESSSASADPAYDANGASAPAAAEASRPSTAAVGRKAKAAAADANFTPRAPGMKYTHYAPRGILTLVSGASPERTAQAAAERLRAAEKNGEITGLLVFDEHVPLYPASPAACVVTLGPLAEPGEAARSLYAALRRFDDAGVTYILSETCPETGLGAALMNRLAKAAGGRIIQAD